MVDRRALLAACERRAGRMEAETAQLVAIDSGSYDAAGVNAVGDALAAMLAPLGCAVRRTPLAGRGDRLAATLELGGGGPRVVLLGHADTVWPAGWPFEARDGYLHGPGVGDMKACLVAALHAIDVACAAGLRRLGAIELLVVPDEELGSPGSREWIEGRVRGAHACLGLEAGWPGGGVVCERGAVGALRIEARGRAAHCSGHEGEGASAVAPLARLVGELEALPGVTVGIFRGGSARQVVPAEAELHVDLRAPDAARAGSLLDRVDGLVARHATPAVPLRLHGGITRPAFPASASARLWPRARAAAADLGIPLRPVRSRGGSDASFAAALGVPALDGLGPVCHDSCSREERVERRSMPERAALLAALLLALGEELSAGRAATE